ncbi:MAG TPA: ATP-dependent DNA helicase RecG [Planctomycetota bacterium]
MSDLGAPAQFLPGVGPKRAELLAKLGLRTLGDLLFHLPSRYFDRRAAVPLAKLRPDTEACVQGEVVRVRGYRAERSRVPVLEVEIAEGAARAKLLWFRQPWRARDFKAGDTVLAAGRVGRGRSVLVEEFEILDGRDPLHAGGVVPAYATTEGLSKRQMRTLVRSALEACGQVPETLPEELLRRRGLPGIVDALRGAHAPASPDDAFRARRRFAYEELFVLQLRLSRRRVALAGDVARRALPVSKELDFRIRKLFPFAFTAAQDRAVAEIRRSLVAGPPMSRLLQGDVGAGKTAVATYALLAAVGNRAQAAIMAPTELLAEQHHRFFARLLEGKKTRTALLTGALGRRERAALLARIAAGDVDLVAGTHALLTEDVRFKDLAMVVIDEQQKFGVLQRAELGAKGERPHVLVMTATPIPRTLALALYGDLDVTVIDQLPPGRRPVSTLYVPEAGRREKIDFIRRALDEGRQVYFVYPLVEESEALEAKAAVAQYDRVAAEFPEHAVALLHGKMSSSDKDVAMDAFRSGRARILVSTTVVEVGVDVPNATIMVIENAERYGLAQLHQLRGRIGRGAHASVCVVFGEKSERIDAFVSTTDGFRIAEEDLRLRKSGDVGGTRQSGLPGFKAARLPEDVELLEWARDDARGVAPETAERLAGGMSMPLLHIG